MSRDMQRQFEAKKKQIGDKPTEAQKKELGEMQRKFQIQMNQARAKANKVLNDYRAQVNRQFREEVRPVAMKIAQDRGASVVNITDPVVLTLLQQNAEQKKTPGAGATQPPSSESTGKPESKGTAPPRFELPNIQDPTVPKKPDPKNN